MTSSTLTASVRPFLKWAGGKRQLLPEIRRFHPEEFRNYLEPFVGGGAVFFDLCSGDRLGGRQAFLSDTNSDLIGCYRAIRDDPASVMEFLSGLAVDYKDDPHTHYYQVRERFNRARRPLAGGPRPNSDSGPEHLAAMLIYLNRTGFNGLFRRNARGAFNVPIGRHTNPTICDTDNLTAVAPALASNVSIDARDFEQTVAVARAGDFVYLDPPYAPVTETARFTGYTADGFSCADQERLQRVVIDLAARGCWVLLNNSSAPIITRLYDGNEQTVAVGIHAYTVSASRAINSNATKRGAVTEYLITNIPRRDADNEVQPGLFDHE